jgi:hypothetical protein
MEFVEKARSLISTRLRPALDGYNYPPEGLDRGTAQTLLETIERAIDEYESATLISDRIAALNTIINAVGTQSAEHSLYGGAGGSTDKTNPNNPKGQKVSSAADAIRYQARKELERLRSRSQK